MREIKFRAWSPYMEEMYPYDYEGDEAIISYAFGESPNLILEIRMPPSAYIEGGEVIERDEEYKWEKNAVFMQYTGLKDKNETEIYDGDITQDKDTIYQIVMMDGDVIRFGAKVIRSNCVICRGMTFPLWQYTQEYHTPQSLGNVIGNIYENPELLKK